MGESRESIIWLALGSGGLFVLWLALSWHFTLLLMGLGAISSLLAALLARKLLAMSGFDTALLPAPSRFLPYAGWLVVEIWKSNIAVAKIIAAPSKIRPGITTLPAPKDASLTAIYANSITLTPGTVTLEANEKGLVVHGIVMDDSCRDSLQDMGKRVAALRPEGGAK